MSEVDRYFKPSEIGKDRKRLQAILDHIAYIHRLVQKSWERYGIPRASDIEQYRRSHA